MITRKMRGFHHSRLSGCPFGAPVVSAFNIYQLVNILVVKICISEKLSRVN